MQMVQEMHFVTRNERVTRWPCDELTGSHRTPFLERISRILTGYSQLVTRSTRHTPKSPKMVWRVDRRV